MATQRIFSDNVQKFIDLIVIDGVAATEAYRQSFDTSRYKTTTITRNAWNLLHREDVQEEIERRRTLANERAGVTVAEIATEFARIAFSDPGEIVQHRRLCCRHCHGINHLYQWRDDAEYEEGMRQWEYAEAERAAAKGPKRPGRPAPVAVGGFGFAFNKPPHPGCPHCMGEGTPDVFIADTTQLTPEQRRLIERVRVTKDGVEIRFRNQSDALTKAGQMLGGFKQTVVLQNPDGSPVQNAPVVVALAPDEAAAKYKEWMDSTLQK